MASLEGEFPVEASLLEGSDQSRVNCKIDPLPSLPSLLYVDVDK